MSVRRGAFSVEIRQGSILAAEVFDSSLNSSIRSLILACISIELLIKYWSKYTIEQQACKIADCHIKMNYDFAMNIAVELEHIFRRDDVRVQYCAYLRTEDFQISSLDMIFSYMPISELIKCPFFIICLNNVLFIDFKKRLTNF